LELAYHHKRLLTRGEPLTIYRIHNKGNIINVLSIGLHGEPLFNKITIEDDQYNLLTRLDKFLNNNDDFTFFATFHASIILRYADYHLVSEVIDFLNCIDKNKRFRTLITLTKFESSEEILEYIYGKYYKLYSAGIEN
jgi:hypothetical protein